MKNKLFLAVLAVCIGASLISCVSFQASGFQMHNQSYDYQALGEFKTTVRINKFLGNPGGVTLFNIGSSATEPAIRSAIQDEINARGGTGAINIKIVYGGEGFGFFFFFLTGGLWAPASVVIKGPVIKVLW
jgi:hypothetical protein